jgi:predicted DNA-binding transcriptional regulator AlpA
MSTTKARKGTKKGIAVPQKLHLDKRASTILTIDANKGDDDLLTTKATAAWLQVSEVWLESGRAAGYGPPHIMLAKRLVRYRRGDTRKWLRQRTTTKATALVRNTALADA